MRIIEIKALSNGAHNNQLINGNIEVQDYSIVIPNGWAVIPDDMDIPETFPFVNIETEEIVHTREVECQNEVVKTVDTGMVDDNGKPIFEEVPDMEVTIETVEYTVMTVTSMTAGELPEPAEPSIEEQIATLKEQLTATDYKVIKCSEAQLAGEELPYDISALHTERQTLRDKINKLEGNAD